MARLSLDGQWQLRWSDNLRGGGVNRLTGDDADMKQAMTAQVPGEVHLDLMRAGLLRESGVELNCLSQRWVEEFFWSYRRTFDATALSAGQRAFLVFETLDLKAEVYLNGTMVGSHSNAFYPARFEVTKALRAGTNTLVVRLESGLWSVVEKPAAGWVGADNYLHKRHWLRQTQSTFGWDWSERLLNVGIRGHAYLEIADGVRCDAVVVLSELAVDLQTGWVTARVVADTPGDKPIKGLLKVQVHAPGAKTGAAVTSSSQEVELKPGLHRVEAKLAVERPSPWWPVNHGPQPLYNVQVTLEVAGQVVGQATKRVGFRHVRINQDPHPQSGRYFVMEVNGKPIFCKGGNFVPADLIMQRIDRARYEGLVRQALAANFNFLRIWGGGLYESDDLYDLCDEKGILVWQEFIFACARYPGTNPEFYGDVMREAVYQIRRLAHHPSLVVWCGNNELEWLNHDPYGQSKGDGLIHPDYPIFHLGLPRALHDEDGTRFYQPSSPYSPDMQVPNADHVGDQHPWSLGFGNTDFRGYRQMSCRFPNEGGFLGPTALPTVKACLLPGENRPGSFAWEIHDNSVNYWGETAATDSMTVQWLGKSIFDMTIEQYCYWAGIVQGEALSEYVKNFRRRMFDTASAIFWMYNDCWPMVRSWTIVDYYLRRTPCFHPVRRAMQPLTVVLAQEDGKIKVFGVNEGPAVKVKARYGTFNLSGGLPVDRTREIELSANTSTLIDEWPSADLEASRASQGAFAILSDAEGRELGRDRMFLGLFREMKWPKPDVRVRREGGKAVFESAAFAWRVCVDLDGEKPYADNFFDVLPDIPLVIDWPSELGEPRVLFVGNL